MPGTLSYSTVGSNRLDEAKRFYDALLGSAGLTPAFEHPSGGRVYGRDGRFCFAVLGPLDGQPATEWALNWAHNAIETAPHPKHG